MSATSFPRNKIKILLLEGVHPSAIKLFKDAGYDEPEVLKTALDTVALEKKISGIHLLGIRSKTQVTSRIIGKAEKLIGLGCFCIGTNQVDMHAAIGNGVAVFNSPFSNTRSVAELVIGECIMLLRRIFEKSDAAQRGEWLKESRQCFELRGKTLGIIGYGHIGSQVSVLAENMGLKVIFYDVEPKLSLGNALPVNSLNELLMHADIVTLHVPGSGSTKNLIGAGQLEKMKNDAILINLSRGDVIDTPALVTALKKKKIGGAAVDVFPTEPKGPGDVFTSPLQGLPNVILTPHIGGSTMEAQENIGIDVASKLISFLETGSSVGSLSVPALSLPIMDNAHRLLHIHKNVPGVLSEINSLLSGMKVNILGQYLKTNPEIGYVVVDVDTHTSSRVLNELKKVKHTIKVRSLY